jgi:hypothetical protein
VIDWGPGASAYVAREPGNHPDFAFLEHDLDSAGKRLLAAG